MSDDEMRAENAALRQLLAEWLRQHYGRATEATLRMWVDQGVRGADLALRTWLGLKGKP